MNRRLLIAIKDQFNSSSEKFNLNTIMEDIEDAFVRIALIQSQGSITKASKKLGIEYYSLRYRVRKFNINAGYRTDNHDEWTSANRAIQNRANRQE